MPALIVVYLFVIGLFALLAQMILPVTFPFLNLVGLGSALVPLVVIYASLELGDERAAILAGILGLAVDLVSTDRLGNSILVLVSLSALIATQAEKRESHTWPFRFLFVLVGTFTYYLLSYTLILAESGHWLWPFSVWAKITFACLMNLILCAPFFFLVGLPPRLMGWRAAHEETDRYNTYAR